MSSTTAPESAGHRLRSTRSFTRMESSVSPFARSTSTTNTDPLGATGPGGLQVNIDYENNDQQPDFFEKGDSSDVDPPDYPEKTLQLQAGEVPDELPIELASLIDRYSLPVYDESRPDMYVKSDSSSR